ncbi:MAG: hypothetical protein A2Z78_01905 [Candidatus Nealsonbacteria bacterium RBG_13_36_15]|uniref:AB hydrolase-1 domain-containing protein n=1 Tax=Candidatus Nealsonbacteria bacterium RBG_13_36_15 TaxID=1801660 RepID=A0A1G2DWE0_9BACT|nr:MAG: hypothetical protein A2Z78_01905 [Candidatus Nealsonbacteria bacterium RBG_13_36_15]
MTEKKILIKDLEANYKISGKGQPILVLHGWGGSSDSWAKVQKILADKGFSVIVPDFPGFGKSKCPKEAWGISNYVQWLKDLIKIVKIEEPFSLLGHSFGGRVAIKFSVKYPEKIKALILCSSAGIKPEKNLKTKTLYYIGKIGNYLFSKKPLRKFKDSARNTFYRVIQQRDYLKVKGTMKETIKKVLTEDLFGYLSQIKVKTLIIWGENDLMVPIKYGYIMEQEIPNSKIIALPKIGHSPHLEIPEKFAKEILQFIES